MLKNIVLYSQSLTIARGVEGVVGGDFSFESGAWQDLDIEL
jgi:hypothetical protein